MKEMTFDDFEDIRAMTWYTGKTTMPMHAARIVKKFMKSGYEVAEVEPEDYGRTKRSIAKSTPATMRKILTERIEELSLDFIISVFQIQNRLFLVRCDM